MIKVDKKGTYLSENPRIQPERGREPEIPIPLVERLLA